ncbi:type IV pilus biogenesis/stability protein PilW [Psychromonas sp. CNPT3]|uniref:type IV pilus biogenesis/stability protein PilW n=1 Tax=Psychromonas sp. CNPT3 TaxID=314282 RepID=UPI00006E42AB|nr:type IV pilus biogenesis/stability protein PilW [Psychromonas sp. CNPT3]AGH80661.1 type IV pilus biogenesis/stability protein PilW [Psychromonas sp. CNPT3]
MRFILAILISTTLLLGCVSGDVTVVTKNTGAGAVMRFDPVGAARTRVKLALLYLRQENMQLAKENLDKALKYQPEDASVNRVFAYYYQKVNESDLAEFYYKKALLLERDNADTYNNYGAFLCRDGRYDAADQAFIKAIEQSAYNAVANTYENAGMCAEKSGKISKALHYYQSALSHGPQKVYLNLALARLYINQKSYEDAYVSLLRYDKIKKASAESLWLWVRLSAAENKKASFDKYSQALVLQFPDSQQALKYLNHDY